jgi:hypothetical protein
MVGSRLGHFEVAVGHIEAVAPHKPEETFHTTGVHHHYDADSDASHPVENRVEN